MALDRVELVVVQIRRFSVAKELLFIVGCKGARKFNTIGFGTSLQDMSQSVVDESWVLHG